MIHRRHKMKYSEIIYITGSALLKARRGSEHIFMHLSYRAYHSIAKQQCHLEKTLEKKTMGKSAVEVSCKIWPMYIFQD